MTRTEGDLMSSERAETLRRLAVESEPHLSSSDSTIWMEKLEASYGDLREAFLWFLDHSKGAEALEMAASLSFFQEERGYSDESRSWLAKALVCPGAETRNVVRANALYGAGILAFRNLDEGRADVYFRECLDIANNLGDSSFIVRATSGLSRLALRRGDTKEVRRLSERALKEAQDHGEKGDSANPLHMLAAAARVEGDLDRARVFYRRNIALNQELGRSYWVAAELENLGALEVLEGNIEAALLLLQESLKSAYERRDKYLTPYVLVWIGRVALSHGDPRLATRLFSAAKAQFEETGLAMDPDEAPEFDKGLKMIHSSLDGKSFSDDWAKGKALSYDDSVRIALEQM